MAKSKIAITLDGRLLDRLDRLVSKEAFGSRSHAIQVAVEEKLERMERGRLARECSKLDRVFEKALAEEGLGAEGDEWPEY
jgi:metal-responsive CopG/Arc/MetJ family transcriptional regulator